VQEARKALAKRLRELREDAELSAIALAAAAGWERTKVSKIEHAARAPSVADIRTWCRICGAEDQTEDLLAALRAVAGMYVEWKRLQRTGLRNLQEQRTRLFERTRQFRLYTSQVVPGLLQTPDYARAVMGAVVRQNELLDDLDVAVAARMKRADLLRKGDHRFAFILEESVLRYRMGGPAVLAGQLEYLLSAMRLPSVSLAVIPFTASRDVYTLGDFSIYDDTEVRVELLTAAVTVTVPAEIAQYRREFEMLASMAVRGNAARRLISDAIAAL
jgi:transcriptional regulator with XRE-family HTH domain